MGHLLLQEEVHLLFVLLQVLLFGLQSFELGLQTRLDLLHLDSLVPDGMTDTGWHTSIHSITHERQLLACRKE